MALERLGVLVHKTRTVGASVFQGATTTVGFLVLYFVLPIVDSHEVGLLRKLGYEFGRMATWCSSPYHVDGHVALLRHLVGPCCDFVKGLIEVMDWHILQDVATSICSLLIVSTSSVLGICSLIGGCIRRQLVVGDVIQVLVLAVVRGFTRFGYEDLAVR
jgi:hypothetical protein